jgi:hypothetical protein
MNDKQIAALFITHVLPAINAQSGMGAVKLARNYQQRQQGLDTAAIVYFHKIGDRRHGHVKRKDVLAVDAFTHTELQVYESTYQISAWVPQDPAQATALTESDVLNVVSSIMQSDSIMAAFRTAGVGILRVTDVRNPYIVDDRDRFEAVPTFDIVLTHSRQSVSTVPAVSTYEANIGRV